jgi:phospho-N-acetylmuramoyl-pentapeptide-transferase
MIKLIVELLQDAGIDFGFFRLIDYVTFRALTGLATALAISLMIGFRMTVALYDRQIRDTSGDFMSIGVSSKRGTPTAGGAMLLISTLLSALLWSDFGNPFLWPLMIGFTYFCLVGFLDDFLKARFKSSLSGLSQIAKTLLMLGFIVPFAIYFVSAWSPVPEELRTLIYIPFYKNPVLDLGAIGFFLFAVFTFFAIINAVNITDGMDGLLCGTASLTLAVYVILAYIVGNTIYSGYLLFPYMAGSQEMSVFGAILIGGVLGFMWFNTYPAEVFLGDTGSLGIGGTLSMMALMTKQEFLFVIVGGVFVFEVFTSLMQQQVGDRIGRRVFHRAPAHHSMTHKGIPEPKVVVRFWIISLILASIGLLSLKIR